MIGGNFVSIYRGIDSYMVAREISDDVWAPTTGRMKEQEKEPYLVTNAHRKTLNIKRNQE